MKDLKWLEKQVPMLYKNAYDSLSFKKSIILKPLETHPFDKNQLFDKICFLIQFLSEKKLKTTVDEC